MNHQAARKLRVLVVGIDPAAVAHLGINAEVVAAALASEQDRFTAAGIVADLCLVGLDSDTAATQIAAQLSGHAYTVVVIGGGIRKPEAMLEFFERVVNLVHRHAPTAAIAFNTSGGNSLEAARRWLASEA